MSAVEAPARIAVIAVCMDRTSYSALSHFVATIPGAMLAGDLDHYNGAEREIDRALSRAKTRVCVVDYDQNPADAIWITERLRSEHPDISVFAASSSSEPERIIGAMRAGSAEYLVKPVQHERVLEALARVEAKQKERTRSKVRGKIVTVLGAKGGTGVTTLALHLALELAAEQQKCVLVDQHPALGDVSLYLGTGRHQYSFYELASNTDRLDQELLQGFLLRHDSGLDLLDSPEAVDALHGAPPSSIEHTLGFLADLYQFVVVDCPPGLTDGTLAAIAQSDKVAIVMTAELPSVRNAVRYMEHLAKLGYNANSIQVVLNRHSKKGPLSDERVERALGRAVSFRVPNSYSEVIRAINAGAPIPSASRSDFSSAILGWANDLVRSKEPARKPDASKAASAAQPRSGVLGLFSR
jgi:pilus assembly protein CpaE